MWWDDLTDHWHSYSTFTARLTRVLCISDWRQSFCKASHGSVLLFWVSFTAAGGYKTWLAYFHLHLVTTPFCITPVSYFHLISHLFCSILDLLHLPNKVLPKVRAGLEREKKWSNHNVILFYIWQHDGQQNNGFCDHAFFMAYSFLTEKK